MATAPEAARTVSPLAAQGTAPIRVVTVADTPITRAGLHALLQGAQDIEIIGDFASVGLGAAFAVRVQADILLVDVGSQGEDLAALAQAGAALPMVVVCPRSDRRTVARLAMTGARGYLCTDMRQEALVRAIRTVHDGGTHLDPDVANTVVECFRAAFRKRRPASPRARRASSTAKNTV